MSASWHHLDRLDPVADANRVHDVHSLGHLPERGVLAVQKGRRTEHDVHLAARGVGIVAAGHAEHPALEFAAVERGLQGVAGAAAADAVVVEGQRLRLRVAELDDEPGLHTVHALAVVEALLRQREKVLHVLGRVLWKELQDDLAALRERDDRARRLGGGLVLGPRECGRQGDGADDEQSTNHAKRSEARQSADYYNSGGLTAR